MRHGDGARDGAKSPSSVFVNLRSSAPSHFNLIPATGRKARKRP